MVYDLFLKYLFPRHWCSGHFFPWTQVHELPVSTIILTGWRCEPRYKVMMYCKLSLLVTTLPKSRLSYLPPVGLFVFITSSGAWII